MVHIGRKIKDVFKFSGMTISLFGKKINKSRTVVYDIFERSTIDTGLLHNIGKTLSHDFFQYYGMPENVFEEPRVPYNKPEKAIDEMRKEIELLSSQVADLRRQVEAKPRKK